MKRFLLEVGVFTCLFAAAPAFAAESDMPLSLVFVPSRDASQVPIEIVFPAKSRPDALYKAQALRKLVEQNGLRPERDGDRYSYFGKCIVQPVQFEVGDASLRVECWSMAMWRGDDPFSAVGAPATPEEAMALINAFRVKHRERMLRPHPHQRKSAVTI